MKERLELFLFCIFSAFVGLLNPRRVKRSLRQRYYHDVR